MHADDWLGWPREALKLFARQLLHSYYMANLFGEGAYRILKKRASRLANCGEMSIQSINCGFYVR